MTDEERYSSGELHRLIQRVDQNVTELRRESKEDRHRIAGEMQAIAGQHVELRSRVTTVEREMREQKRDMAAVDDKADAAHRKVDGAINKVLGVSLAIGAITTLAALLISLFKH